MRALIRAFTASNTSVPLRSQYYHDRDGYDGRYGSHRELLCWPDWPLLATCLDSLHEMRPLTACALAATDAIAMLP